MIPSWLLPPRMLLHLVLSAEEKASHFLRPASQLDDSPVILVQLNHICLQLASEQVVYKTTSFKCYRHSDWTRIHSKCIATNSSGIKPRFLESISYIKLMVRYLIDHSHPRFGINPQGSSQHTCAHTHPDNASKPPKGFPRLSSSRDALSRGTVDLLARCGFKNCQETPKPCRKPQPCSPMPRYLTPL